MDHGNKKIIIWANIILVMMIVVHDADHFRQAICWNYPIPWSVKLINILVYVPSVVALHFARKEKKAAIPMTQINGLFIAAAFAKIHLFGASLLPYWGIWNKSFFVLGADTLSWIILAMTVATGVGVAIIARVVRHRLSVA